MTEPDITAAQIDAKLSALGDWRGAILSRMRDLVVAADPGICESIKWVKPSNPAGVIVWERAGIIATGEVYKACVKLTFAHGAALEDDAGLFNAGFGGGTRRAIDIAQEATVDADAFTALVQRAVAFNLARQKPKKLR